METDSFSYQAMHCDIVGFNVGGFVFQTKRTTLSKKPINNKPTYFDLLFKGEKPTEKDKDGNYFIDRYLIYFFLTIIL